MIFLLAHSFENYADTYFSLGGVRSSSIYNTSGQVLRQANDLLLNLAVSFNASKINENKEEIASMFVLLTKHLTDQGFAAGSAMGTLHHLGYSMRNSIFLLSTGSLLCICSFCVVGTSAGLITLL
jgi:chondroitin-sulfate-ABC endolyase/exolyase